MPSPPELGRRRGQGPSARVRRRRTAVVAAVLLVLVSGVLLATCRGRGATKAARTIGSTTTTIAPPDTGPPEQPNTQHGLVPGQNVYAGTLHGLSPTVARFPARVYVPNSDGASVDVIDPTTFKVVSHFKTGKTPEHITPSWDMQTLYVDNTDADTLTPIDPMTGKASTPIPVRDPYNLYFTPDGAHAVVVAERYNALDFRDPHTWALQGTVPIGHAGADHLDFSADGSYFILSCEFSGWLVKVDVATMKVVGELKVGGSPIDVKLAPDGASFYVANQKRNGVEVIDGDALAETSFIPTGPGTHGLYLSRDTKQLYATNRGGPGRNDGSVSLIDVTTQKLVRTWPTGGTPDMGGVSTDGTRLWLSGRYRAEVYVIDTTTGVVLHTIKVGKGPHGLCLFPQPGQFSLGHTGVFR